MECPFCHAPITSAARHRVTVDWYEIPEQGGPTLLADLVPLAGFQVEIITCHRCQMFHVHKLGPTDKGHGHGEAILQWGPPGLIADVDGEVN